MSSHRRIAAIVGLFLLVALSSACVDYDPRGEPPASPNPSLSPSPAQAAGSPIHVVLANATSHAVTIDVTDESSSLVSATSGAPGDGASVDAYTLVVTNQSPTSLRLTWVGGPCDSANSLAIDAARSTLLLVQPECPGDAIATDRILDLEFTTAVTAADFHAFVQDGVDTPG